MKKFQDQKLNLVDEALKFDTSHSLNPVPFIIVDDKKYEMKNVELGLANVAPTVTKLF